MKYTDVLTTALSNLWRNKVRTILTVLAVFIGALAIALTVGVNIGVGSFLEEEIGGLGSEEMLQVWPESENMNSPFAEIGEPEPYFDGDTEMGVISEANMEAMLDIEGVESVNEILFGRINNIRSNYSERYIFTASIGIPDLNAYMLSGRYLDFDTDDYEVVIDEEFVEALGFNSSNEAVGETAILQATRPDGEVQEVEATIVGVQRPNVLIGGGAGGFTNFALNDRIMEINTYGLPENMLPSAFFAAVIVENVDAIPDVREELREMGFASSTLEEQVNMIMGVINAISGGLILFATIALIAATFGIVNTLYMSVQERTKEIGLNKALGLGKRKVFLIFCWEAALIGFFGSALGLMLAIGVGAVINQLAYETFLSALPGLQLVQFTLLPSLLIVLIIMFIAFLAGTLPARRAARLDPIMALRTE